MAWIKGAVLLFVLFGTLAALGGFFDGSRASSKSSNSSAVAASGAPPQAPRPTATPGISAAEQRIARAESTRQARADMTAEALERVQLELQRGWGCNRSSNAYMTLEGRVRNISGGSMRHVTAVAIYEKDDGTFVTSDDATVDYDPLLDGQVSPFKVITRYNPAIVKCHVEFKFNAGGAIRYVDQ